MANLRKLEILPGLIGMWGYNLNNMITADDIVFLCMSDMNTLSY